MRYFVLSPAAYAANKARIRELYRLHGAPVPPQMRAWLDEPGPFAEEESGWPGPQLRPGERPVEASFSVL